MCEADTRESETFRRMNLKEQWKNRQLIFPIMMLVICMITAFFFCCEKAGFHEDEYYTYYTTARSTGFFVEDGKWMPREEIAREFTVMPGEGFDYGLVKLVQSWDVHPPMYYFAIHTVESLFPSTLSKWTGLSVNLFFFFFDLILLYILSYKLFKKIGATEKDSELTICAVLTMALYGLSIAGLSAVTLVRMYSMFVFFILWVSIIHVDALKKEKLGWKDFYIPLAVCTFLGFMTQYYFFIYLFFLAGAFCLYRLLVNKKWIEVLTYGGVMVVVFGLAYLFYPAYPSHMFSGQRGGQATENFFDLRNTWHRMTFFGSLVNKFLFAKCALLFIGFALVLIICYVVRNVMHKSEKKRILESESMYLWMFGLSILGYYLGVAKTGLFVGDAAIRYMVPICPIIVVTVLAIMQRYGRKVQYMKAITNGVLIAWMLLDLLAIWNKEVLFLYPQDAVKIESAKEWNQADIPVAYAYDSMQTWCIWDSSDELLEYKEVYLFEENREDITLDSKIKEADQLILYASTVGDAEACLAKVLKGCPNLSAYELKYEDNFCNVYYLQ